MNCQACKLLENSSLLLTELVLALIFLAGCNNISFGYTPNAPIADSSWSMAWSFEVTDLFGPNMHVEICKFDGFDFSCLGLP